MLPTELIHRIAVAMKGYSKERLDKIYHAAKKADDEADFPPWNIKARADLFIIGCAYMNKDIHFGSQLLYLAYSGIRDAEFYTEDELVDAIKEVLELRKLRI